MSAGELLPLLAQHRLVPVVVIDEARSAGILAEALVDGGLPVAEVTFRTAAAVEVIGSLAARGDLLVGAGTVLTTDQVDAAVDAGARYIVSPGLDPKVVERAQTRGVLALPGAVTATEVQAALALGLEAVKFFPAGTSGGAKAIAALAAPFTGLGFVPTGGVGPANLAEYLAVPAVLAVGGSWMVSRDLLRAGDVDGLRTQVAEAVRLAAELRPSA